MKDNQLKIPEVGEFVRNIGKLIKVETIQPPPPPPYTDYIFEEEEARCELRYNGETIKHITTLNDFYGLGAGVTTAITEMKNYCRNHNIHPYNDLEVVVIKIIRQYRANKLDKGAFYSEGYYDFETKGEYSSQRGLPEPTEEIIWSSKNNESWS